MMAVTLEGQLEGTNLTSLSRAVIFRILPFGECLQVIPLYYLRATPRRGTETIVFLPSSRGRFVNGRKTTTRTRTGLNTAPSLRGRRRGRGNLGARGGKERNP